MTKHKQFNDDDFLPYTYSVHIGDIADSLFAKVFNKSGKALTDNQTKALLHMYGIDVARKNDVEELDINTTMRSPITGDVVNGGWLYVGFERTDNIWRKSGIKNLQKFLYTQEGVEELIKQMEGQ
jgi:hypothetical protein